MTANCRAKRGTDMLPHLSPKTNFHFRRQGPSAQAEDSGVMSGLVAGTRIATSRGWQRVEDVAEGDRVLTFDNGLREVRAIARKPLWEGDGQCPRQFRPLNVPAGVLGNGAAMMVLPRQALVVESDAAEAGTGDPFALVRAEDLEGIGGIRRVRNVAPVDVFVLQFDNDEIVFTAHGALCICAAGGDLVQRAMSMGLGAEYHLLSVDTDAELLADIRCELLAGLSEYEDGHANPEFLNVMPRVA